ncbi:hypothetical protein [Candidatus Mycoplasma haematominutum]|uniref:Transmembrane protein n=1 Tax=Candidatus Mycoplasma haematominutum 'Birmingham 1' TaxID=1116213 RepID=G8C3A7_9MOLU|nr:hypothetical protein [Candidatus Mycoplasma haematominutum]CCE66805.1 conserved haemoplasma hypothetical protein [Candidatus Mycoplasma haematominutum 'Birmingham 1']
MIQASVPLLRGATPRRNKYRPLLFFNLIPNIVFGCFIGFFVHLIIIAGVLIALFTQSRDYQLLFYSAIGVVVFSISFVIYRYRFWKVLRIPSYKSFLISRNKLLVWLWWTFNAWLLSCWAAMVCVGVFNGFSWTHQTSPQQLVLTSNGEITKLNGIVLWVVHWFLIALLSLSYKRLFEVFRYGQEKLKLRRAQLKQFRIRAEEEIKLQTAAA